MRYRLEPFSADSTQAYIKHRLRLAGCPRMPFTPDAIDALHARSGGTPRVINTLCDNALFEAFLARTQEIDGAMIDQIADNLGLETGLHAKAAPPRPTVLIPPPPPSAPPITGELITEPEALPPPPPPPDHEDVIAAAAPTAPVNAPRGVPVKPARGVDLAEIDRYLEGLGKL